MECISNALRRQGWRTCIFVVSLCLGLACQKSTPSEKQKVVHLAVWTNYVTPEMKEQFEKKSGFTLTMSNYSSNEELLAKLQAGAEGFDVAVPSDYMVKALKELQLVQPLEALKLSALGELDARVLSHYFDPKNEVSLPLTWGTTGIAVFSSKLKSPLSDWKGFFESPELVGKKTMLDDVRESLGAALKSQGYSLNTKDPKELESARNALMKAKDSLKGFNSETLPLLVGGEVVAAQAYSHDALMAWRDTQGAVDYILPTDGCTLWVDSLVIPKGAKNIEGAYALINFLASPEISADRAQRLLVAPANKVALKLLPAALQKNKSLFPDYSTTSRCEMMQDLGEALVLWDRMWTEVKAR